MQGRTKWVGWLRVPGDLAVVDLSVIGLTDLLEGQIDPALVRNKIVLVGSVARSVGDVMTSPVLDHASTAALPRRSIFGVEAHAQFTAQLLQEARGLVPPLRPTPPAVWMAALALAALLGAAAGGLIAARWSAFPC